MKIFLIGITGSGKSTLGKPLAEKLGYGFIDLDDYIIEQEDKTIEEIFREEGEMYFRELERNAIHILSGLKEDLVISTGGGAPYYFGNMTTINDNGISIWLNIDHEIIVERLFSQENKENRPLVKGRTKDELGEFIRGKIEERKPFYSLAHIHIENQDPQVEHLEEAVNKLIKAY